MATFSEYNETHIMSIRSLFLTDYTSLISSQEIRDHLGVDVLGQCNNPPNCANVSIDLAHPIYELFFHILFVLVIFI